MGARWEGREGKLVSATNNSAFLTGKSRIGKISAQPHTTLCIQFLDRENNDKNNTLPWENRFVLQQDGTVRKFYPRICSKSSLSLSVKYV